MVEITHFFLFGSLYSTNNVLVNILFQDLIILGFLTKHTLCKTQLLFVPKFIALRIHLKRNIIFFCLFICLLIYSLNKCSLSIHFMSETMLSTRDTSMNKIVLLLRSIYLVRVESKTMLLYLKGLVAWVSLPGRPATYP